MRERFLGRTFENLSGEKKILKIGQLGVELWVAEKSDQNNVSGIGLIHSQINNYSYNFGVGRTD